MFLVDIFINSLRVTFCFFVGDHSISFCLDKAIFFSQQQKNWSAKNRERFANKILRRVILPYSSSLLAARFELGELHRKARKAQKHNGMGSIFCKKGLVSQKGNSGLYLNLIEHIEFCSSILYSVRIKFKKAFHKY